METVWSSFPVEDASGAPQAKGGAHQVATQAKGSSRRFLQAARDLGTSHPLLITAVAVAVMLVTGWMLRKASGKHD